LYRSTMFLSEMFYSLSKNVSYSFKIYEGYLKCM